MPIKACADKLDAELRAYGCPPQFPEDSVQDAAVRDWPPQQDSLLTGAIMLTGLPTQLLPTECCGCT